MALRVTRGSWAGLEIISEKTDASVKRRSGWVSWKNWVPIWLLGMCEAIASTGRRERLASYSPLMRWRLPGPHEPAHAVSRPVTSASPAAAKAAASSWRTWTQSMPGVRRTASTTGLSESPTMP